MPDQEWIKTLDDGRKVKFIYQELPEDGAFITAQIAGNEVVYSVVLAKAGNPPGREDVVEAGNLSFPGTAYILAVDPSLARIIPTNIRPNVEWLSGHPNFRTNHIGKHA